MIVSELVSNAVQHARRPCIRVAIDHPGAARVRIGVIDFSKVPPSLQEPGADEESGRGLALVAQLAEDWGTDVLPCGKRVWALLCARDDGEHRRAREAAPVRILA